MNNMLLYKMRIIGVALFILCACPFFKGWADATKWIEVGPGGGGALQAFAFDSEMPDRVYLTSDMNGVFMSDDAGDTWGWSSFGAANEKGGIAVDPNKPEVLYVVGPDGIYRTKDRAKHWQMVYSKGNGYRGINNQTFGPLNESIFGRPGQSIAISASGVVYVPTIVGDVMISRNQGNSWNRVQTGVKGNVQAIIPVDKQGVIAAIYENGIYISKDEGNTWKKVLSDRTQNFISIAIHPVKKTIYALVGKPSVIEYSPIFTVSNFPVYLYQSNDSGETWTIKHTFLDLAIRAGRQKIDVSKEGTIIILSHYGPVRSTDEGNTWTSTDIVGNKDDEFIYASIKRKPVNPHIIYADPHRAGRWFMTNMVAAFRSDDDGKTWHYKVKGLRQESYWFVKVNPQDPDIVIASDLDHGLIKSNDGGKTWRNIIIDNPYEECDELRFLPNDATYKTLYAFYSWSDPFITKSTDTGETWKIIKRWHGKKRNSMQRFTLTRGESSPVMFVGEPGVGIWRSVDEGSSWELKNVGLPVPREMSFIQFLESDSRGNLYAGIASSGKGKGGVFKSTDSGGTWFSINRGLNDLSVRQRGFEIDPNNPDILWVGAGRSVFRSVDGGKSWEKRIDGVFASAILVEPGNSDAVYVASFTGGGIMEQFTEGIYKSVDGGNYFFKISDNLFRTIGSSYRVFDLEYGWKGSGHIWAGPYGGGLIYSSQ